MPWKHLDVVFGSLSSRHIYLCGHTRRSIILASGSKWGQAGGDFGNVCHFIRGSSDFVKSDVFIYQMAGSKTIQRIESTPEEPDIFS